MARTNERILAATRKGLFVVERSGGRWKIASAAFLGDHCPMALSDARRETLFAAIHHEHFGDKMHRSGDGGRTWQECATPTYPEQPEGVESIEPFSKKPMPWKTKLVWALETDGRAEGAGLWCGTIPGGLFRSRDAGDSWDLVRPLWDHPDRLRWAGGGAEFPGIHSICVDPRDPKRVAVGVSCGGVWRTGDDGATWTVASQGMRAEYMPPEMAYDPIAQDPHRVVQCKGAPDRWWCQHHNGVFRSTDDSRSWTEITNVKPAVFGFAVAVHPDDPDTAWFVPAVKDEKRFPMDGKVVVARTRDGGGSFDVLRKGLPQEHAYDLTFRHGLDVDGSGDRLAFGSTTGSLFVSEDQGDSWTAVSEHLPPIYAVRFA